MLDTELQGAKRQVGIEHIRKDLLKINQFDVQTSRSFGTLLHLEDDSFDSLSSPIHLIVFFCGTLLQLLRTHISVGALGRLSGHTSLAVERYLVNTSGMLLRSLVPHTRQRRICQTYFDTGAFIPRAFLMGNRCHLLRTSSIAHSTIPPPHPITSYCHLTVTSSRDVS